MGRDQDENSEDDFAEVVQLEINGELDLHTFNPAEVKDLIPDYVRECHARGIYALRIVHGKGKGTLRRTVHGALERLTEVASYRLAPAERGGWGATLVDLKPPPEE